MLGFLYFGRLEKEKWFDAIINMILNFWKDSDELPFQLFVFGSWTYEKEIMQLAHRFKTIHFFWRQPRETIRRYTSNCNFVLAPSTCLETFWLVALSAMERWIPTIGFARWWAMSFIDPALDLNQPSLSSFVKWCETKSRKAGEGVSTKWVEDLPLSEKLYTLITRLGKEEFFTGSLPIAQILENHSKENRKANIAYLLWEKKKILIISDFINKIGGIETYINDVKDLLHGMWYEVQLFGAKLPKWILGKFLKYLGIAWAICNFRASIQLRRKIKKMNPDLIRYHSIMRYIGRMPLRATRNAKAEKRMMYHDMGYFYPFPSKLEREEQIKTPFTFSNFVSSVKTKNPIKKLAIAGKYFSLKLIKNQLEETIDLHIVPSAFMKPIVHKSYVIDDEKITVLPHFIQE